MEWMIPVNEMLKDEITKVNYTLIPPGCQGDARAVRIVQESLGKLIDSLGEQSATAQGLSKAITTAEKLRNAQTHVLYLLKDAAGKNGEGEIIGFLKVAYKHLYLFDERDKVCQVEPMCVLDFYVSGARQRRGNGKRLFDYMLKDTGSRPQDLAVDGPSSKMETFLAKNYGVNQLIRQSNNFAVSPAFFIKSPGANKSGRNTPVIPSAAVGRFAARKPPSSISDGFESSPVNSETLDRLETLVLEKTLTANIVGVVSSDTMLVSLVDDTTVPPLDVAREIVGTKPTPPVSKAPEQFSAPETERGEGFKREKSYTEERRWHDDFGQREGSFQNRRGKPWESHAAASSGDIREESARPHYGDRDNGENGL